MRYISLFSGIEAASCAWESLGWQPVAFSEIDQFPCAVLAQRFPNVPNLGDITQIDWKEVIEKYGAVDLVIGGSPCQSFSIAGGRESLDGESRLMFEYIRAIREIRPRWLLWENVPGVLSVRDNAFGQLLGEISDLGYGLAWRVLDAQFFGVAQRRRRVYVVASLAGGGAAAAVLFESESVSGNTKSSREKREELAAGTASGVGASSQYGEITGTLTARYDSSPCAERGQNIVTFRTDHLSQNGRINDDSGCSFTIDTTNSNAVVCMADDNSNAAIDNDLCGSLKVGGGRPLIATDKT